MEPCDAIDTSRSVILTTSVSPARRLAGIYGLPLHCKSFSESLIVDRTAGNISGLSLRPSALALMTFARRNLVTSAVLCDPRSGYQVLSTTV